MNLPDKVKEKLRVAPDEPGCYLMRDRRGRIIYVGKAASLRKRVQSYFREASLVRGDPKLRGLVKSVHDLEFVVVRNEAEAILTEGRLIKEYKPWFNVKLRDDKRFLLIRIDPREKYPRLTLCRIRKDDACRYFGPYASSAAARAALDFAEKTFGLRKCATGEPDAQTYKHCINDIVRYCSAPCIDRISEADYRRHVEDAEAFLDGAKPECLAGLREEMIEAAGKKNFERAAALRDTLFLLQSAVKQKARIASTPEMKAEETSAGLEQLRNVLKLDRVPRIIEAFDVSNISGTYAVGSMICFVDGLPSKNKYRRFRIKTVTGSNDPAMMAEIVRRRLDLCGKEKTALPDLVVIDGGITQLHAAREALTNIGFGGIPSVSLAKRYEELYWKDDEAPLRLERESAGLKLLQRLRDEAHRFAIAYHLRIRNRLMRDSALDDIHGIGERKKRELLATFGSVRRIREASVEDIAKVRGIGYKMAAAILKALKGTAS